MITSANTSINTLNRIYKILAEDFHMEGTTILDYGCGKYNTNKDFIEEHGYSWFGFDPYNRSKDENEETEIEFMYEYPDIIVCNNVLNVVDDSTMDSILDKIKTYTSGANVVYFTIYEGNKSGIGEETKADCYQRNEKVKDYISRLNQYFSYVKKLPGTNIVCCRL